ncbi:MAG: hypothetical protein VB855_11355 [Pirellulaceae bacterium]
MVRQLLIILFVIGAIGFTGCQSARYVLKEVDHGVVAIPSTETWPVNHREKADMLMHQHFPTGYDIVREEEVPVGAETSTHSSESSSFSQTRDTMEWRISYRRSDTGTVPGENP